MGPRMQWFSSCIGFLAEPSTCLFNGSAFQLLCMEWYLDFKDFCSDGALHGIVCRTHLLSRGREQSELGRAGKE